MRYCGTCRYGERHKVGLVECRLNPIWNIFNENHWCYQWATKLAEEIEDDEKPTSII